MSTKRNVILFSIAALVVAVSILAVSVLSGFPLTQIANVNTTGSLTSSGAPAGVLSILLTDPPHIPSGVTKVYISYSNVAVHVSGAGNLSGWTTVKDSGSIELLSTVNISQTISSVKITKGDYNLLRLNISSAKVTYNTKNYTAFVPLSELTVPIIGGIEVVDASKPSATIINIEPTVMNIGSASNPEFIIRPAAKAFPVPSSEVSEEMEHEGSRISLVGKAWWKDVQEKFTANAQITTATLTAKSLTFTVKNTGSQATKLRIVVVVPLVTVVTTREHESFPVMLSGSSIFIIYKNGTLVPIEKFVLTQRSTGMEADDFVKALVSEGYNLNAGASATLSYSGAITFGFHLPSNQVGLSTVLGQQYLVTALGDEALASYVVVAGQ